MGTVNCLELAKQHQASFIFLSTSRVYPIAALEGASFVESDTRFEWTDQQPVAGLSSRGVTEDFTLRGSRSFYGTTKLASELLIEEYNALSGLRTVINRCGVLTGAWQMGKVDQGVVVLWATRHFWKGKLGYFGYGGEGKQVRDILHISDLFRLIDQQVHEIDRFNGGLFNVGGGKEISTSLQELTAICEDISGNRLAFERVVENRAADLRIYITDNQKITDFCGWKPQVSVREIMAEIFDWIAEHEHDLKPILG